MPSEPDNKVEELVQTYAQKRRDDAGPSFELHPAIRQLLQGEVVRQRSKSSGRSRSWLGLLAGLAPRLGFALSLLVVVGIVLWKVNLPSEATRRPAYKLAKADRIAPTSPQPAVPANLPQPAPLAAPLSKQERSSVLSTADSRRLRASAAKRSAAPRSLVFAKGFGASSTAAVDGTAAEVRSPRESAVDRTEDLSCLERGAASGAGGGRLAGTAA